MTRLATAQPAHLPLLDCLVAGADGDCWANQGTYQHTAKKTYHVWSSRIANLSEIYQEKCIADEASSTGKAKPSRSCHHTSDLQNAHLQLLPSLGSFRFLICIYSLVQEKNSKENTESVGKTTMVNSLIGSCSSLEGASVNMQSQSKSPALSYEKRTEQWWHGTCAAYRCPILFSEQLASIPKTKIIQKHVKKHFQKGSYMGM